MILQNKNPIRMVRELKGAPLSILMVLSLVHKRVTQEYLERATGYTDKPVSQALAYLQENGLADHINSGWQLIKQIRMEFPVPLELEEDVESEDIAAEISENVNTSRNNSDSLITTTLNNKDLIDSVVVISNNAKSRNNSDFEANLKEFKQQGIARNRRTEALARMKHVNPEYICAHMKGLKRKDSKGLAIMRMEQGEEAPERTKDMLSPEEIRARYGEWET